MNDRYGGDVLSGNWRVRARVRGAPRPGQDVRARKTAAELGLVVEDVETGWCGAVVRVEKAGGMQVVHLQDRRGRSRGFPLGPGFLLEGAPVILTLPASTATGQAAAGSAMRVGPRTASGSTAVEGVRARVASGSRIFVEGKHDAELVEKVWGDDLRIEGVVVEMLDGVDELDAVIRAFQPAKYRRLGVLVDHLTAGTKESRLVHSALGAHPSYAPYVKILGHPYVDVWQSIRPERLGLASWPVIPPGQSWKHGIVAELGWPHETQTDIAQAWRRILATVRTYADLEPTLLASVEELIDFVTATVSA